MISFTVSARIFEILEECAKRHSANWRDVTIEVRAYERGFHVRTCSRLASAYWSVRISPIDQSYLITRIESW